MERLGTLVLLYKELTMLSQEQIDILTDMFGLEWGDYVEYLEDE
jgi:hypothetical protein|tara:strand:- start:36 stop:167 length:132 start_codon:yes stop_codon:yes gene_type:complete